MGPPHPLLSLAELGPPPARGPGLPASEVQDPRSISRQEFEIELEGSQSLRILCYEKCYDKSKVNKDNNEIVDKIMGKGQIQVRGRCGQGTRARLGELPGGGAHWEGFFSCLSSWSRCLAFCDVGSELVGEKFPSVVVLPCWRGHLILAQVPVCAWSLRPPRLDESSLGFHLPDPVCWWLFPGRCVEKGSEAVSMSAVRD